MTLYLCLFVFLVQQSELESSNKGFVALLLPPQSSPSKTPVQTLTRGDICQSTTFQNSSMTSNVSLTVSPSLKTPSFLGQTGTFSFRICPPTDQGTKSQTQQGVLLPGGFTLIQLPSQNTNGDSQQVPCENTGGTAHLNWLGVDIAAKARELLSGEMVKQEFFTAPKCNDDTSSEESIELNRQVESGGNDSESSDFSEESDEVQQKSPKHNCLLLLKLTFMFVLNHFIMTVVGGCGNYRWLTWIGHW